MTISVTKQYKIMLSRVTFVVFFMVTVASALYYVWRPPNEDLRIVTPAGTVVGTFGKTVVRSVTSVQMELILSILFWSQGKKDIAVCQHSLCQASSGATTIYEDSSTG